MKEPYKDQERVGSNIPSSCKQLFLLSLAFYPLLRVIGRRHWKEIEDLGLRFFSSLKVSGCLNDTGFFLVSVACIGRPQRLLAVLWQTSVGLCDYCYYSISHYTLAAFTIPNSMSVSLVYLTARPPSEDTQHFLRLWRDNNYPCPRQHGCWRLTTVTIAFCIGIYKFS